MDLNDVTAIMTGVAAVLTAGAAFGQMLQGWRRRPSPSGDVASDDRKDVPETQ